MLRGVNRRLLDLGSGKGSEVVGGLEAHIPCMEVDVGEIFTTLAFEEDVKRLTLINPLTALRCSFDKPFHINLEGLFVLAADIFWNFKNLRNGTIVVLHFAEHFGIPQTDRFEFLDEVRVYH